MTLIEIIVVITILGMIAAAVTVAVIPRLGEARKDTARLDIHTILQAADLYKAKTGQYPDTAAGLKQLVDGQYLPKTPMDPWGGEYVYMREGNTPVVTSYGGDHAAGGSGEDADISSKDGASGKAP